MRKLILLALLTFSTIACAEEGWIIWGDSSPTACVGCYRRDTAPHILTSCDYCGLAIANMSKGGRNVSDEDFLPWIISSDIKPNSAIHGIAFMMGSNDAIAEIPLTEFEQIMIDNIAEVNSRGLIYTCILPQDYTSVGTNTIPYRESLKTICGNWSDIPVNANGHDPTDLLHFNAEGHTQLAFGLYFALTGI